MSKWKRGEVWLVDLGMAAKIRPCLVLSVSPGENDRKVATLVPHTTAVRGGSFEVPLAIRFLKTGAFNLQNLVSVAPNSLLKRLGVLAPDQIKAVEAAGRLWLGLAPADGD